MSRNSKRRIPVPKNFSAPGSDFEKQLFFEVVRASGAAIHTQNPINRIKVMDIYFRSMTADAIILADMFVQEYREMLEEVPKDSKESA